MGKSYVVPPNTRFKEKVVGGILTANQAGWIGGGFVLGLITFGLLFGLLGPASLFFALIVSFSGVPFAFYKKNQLTLFEYIKFKRQFDKKTKKIPNKRKVM